jgi:hypothetical protein
VNPGARLALHLLGAALAMPVSACPVAAGERVATAIVFAVDVSGSVDAGRYELQRNGIAAVFLDPAIEQILADGLAVTLMEWSDGHAVVVPWRVLRSVPDARALAGSIAAVKRSPGVSTELSLALLSAADLLDRCPCDTDNRVIDISGDGPNNGPISTPIARDAVVARGIRINGLPIVTAAEPELADWYRANVVGGRGAFLEAANGYEDFARAMRRKFMREVSSVPPVRYPSGGAGVARRVRTASDP